jgi:hypothetical protein
MSRPMFVEQAQSPEQPAWHPALAPLNLRLGIPGTGPKTPHMRSEEAGSWSASAPQSPTRPIGSGQIRPGTALGPCNHPDVLHKYPRGTHPSHASYHPAVLIHHRQKGRNFRARPARKSKDHIPPTTPIHSQSAGPFGPGCTCILAVDHHDSTPEYPPPPNDLAHTLTTTIILLLHHTPDDGDTHHSSLIKKPVSRIWIQTP